MTTVQSIRAARRCAPASAVIVLAALVLAACGSNSSSSPATTTARPHTVSATQYADSVCGSISGWISRIETESGSLQNNVKNASSLSAARGDLAAFLQRAATATDGLISSVQHAGQPDVANGAQAASEVNSALTSVRSAFVEARNKALQLPVNDPNAFANGAASLSTTITSQAQQASSTLERLGSGNAALNSAFNSSAACKNVAGQTSSTSAG